MKHLFPRTNKTQSIVTSSTRSFLRGHALPLAAAVTAALVSLPGPAFAKNDAILNQLGQLRDSQQNEEILFPTESRLKRVQAAQNQFTKVEIMIQLKQYNAARLQLREGSASTLRKDLRDAVDLYIPSQVAAGTIAELESLDAALRSQDVEKCNEHLKVLQASLQEVIAALSQGQSPA